MSSRTPTDKPGKERGGLPRQAPSSPRAPGRDAYRFTLRGWYTARPMSPARPWTVHKPGPIVPFAAKVWLVDDEVPGLKGATRRMTIIRRADGTLVFFNAIPLPDELLCV